MSTKEAQIRFPIFKERFNQLRGRRTQAEFAEFLDLSRPTVGFYENGTRLPDVLTLKIIAEKCKVTADWILGLSNNMKNENIAIGQMLGLSDKAIEVLQFFHGMSDGQSFISTVNYLLEQEYPEPYGDIEYQIFEERYLEWESKNYIPILSWVSNYLKVNLNSDKMLEITASGALEEKYNGPGFKLTYDVLTAVSKNDIIEKVLLLEIQERLQRTKRKINESEENSNR